MLWVWLEGTVPHFGDVICRIIIFHLLFLRFFVTKVTPQKMYWLIITDRQL